MPVPPIPPVPQPTVPSTQLAYGSSGNSITSSPIITFDGTNLNVTGGGSVVDTLTTTTDYVAANALEGDYGYSSADINWEAKDKIGNALLRRVILPDVADGSTITSTSETPFYSSAIPIAANAFAAGRLLRFEYFGILSTAIAAPGTLTLKVKLGTAVVATVVTPTLVTSLSSTAFTLSGWAVCRTVGSGGTFEALATFAVISETTGLPIVTDRGLGHNVTVDTTGSCDFSVTATFSATGNSITARSRILEI